MTGDELLDLIDAMHTGQRVRVFDDARLGVVAEGLVVTYYSEPVIVVRQDDGSEVAVGCRLPREVVTERVLRGTR